jgi:hypothetical protein
MNQLEGLTYKQHPTYSHFYGTTDGRVFSSLKNKFVGRERTGHKRVYISSGVSSLLRYRIIWECFHGLLSSGIDIDHINGNSLDDRLCNLQAMTRSEHNKKTMADNPGRAQRGGETKQFKFQASKEGKTIYGGSKDKTFLSILGYVNYWNLRAAFVGSGYTSWSYNGWTITRCKEDIEGEEWKTGTYNGKECTVSNMGRVKIGQRITYGTGHCGYLRTVLGYKKQQVHRLVCSIFNGSAPSALHQVDHINGIKTDNRSLNLEWVVPAENTRRMYALKRSRMEEDVE